MTFRHQVFLTAAFGAVPLTLGLGKLRLEGAKDTGAFLWMGITIIGVGVFVRRWQRRAWISVLAEPDRATARARLLNGPFGRVWAAWLHLGPDGHPRD